MNYNWLQNCKKTKRREKEFLKFLIECGYIVDDNLFIGEKNDDLYKVDILQKSDFGTIPWGEIKFQDSVFSEGDMLRDYGVDANNTFLINKIQMLRYFDEVENGPDFRLMVVHLWPDLSADKFKKCQSFSDKQTVSMERPPITIKRQVKMLTTGVKFLKKLWNQRKLKSFSLPIHAVQAKHQRPTDQIELVHLTSQNFVTVDLLSAWISLPEEHQKMMLKQ